MIIQKTVFVIGAGASHDAGLPLGTELRGSIASLLTMPTNGGIAGPADVFIGRALREAISHDQKRGSEADLIDAARLIEQAMPHVASIDVFLNNHSGNAALELCGKLAIVRAILIAERNSTLYFDPRNGSQPSMHKLADTWYPRLFNMLQDRLHLDDIDRMFENVSFVVFNYDRCLEHYLAFALRATYNLTIDRAAEVISKATIIHPYGSVGRLPWQRNGGLSQPFGGDDMVPLLKLAGQIKTFSERVEEESVTKAMRTAMEEAQRVVFLGFAYHSQNMELLQSEMPQGVVSVFGTTYGMSEPNTDVIRSRLPGTFRRADGTVIERLAAVKCANLLDDYSLMLIN